MESSSGAPPSEIVHARTKQSAGVLLPFVRRISLKFDLETWRNAKRTEDMLLYKKGLNEAKSMQQSVAVKNWTKGHPSPLFVSLVWAASLRTLEFFLGCHSDYMSHSAENNSPRRCRDLDRSTRQHVIETLRYICALRMGSRTRSLHLALRS